MASIEPARARGRDHLTQLPAELLHLIFSYLLPTHAPDRAAFDPKQEKSCSHALDKVAATSKMLRAEVNEWAQHFLLSHKDITKFEPPKSTTKKTGTTNYLRGRKGMLTWCSTHCIFCGKKSARSAILANGFRCCAACDKAQWYVDVPPNGAVTRCHSLHLIHSSCSLRPLPIRLIALTFPHPLCPLHFGSMTDIRISREKITLTDAKKMYGLKEENLLPDQHVNSPTSRKLMAQLGLPRARYGVYICQGARATMFLIKDVKQLAALVHGELESYMAKRGADRDARNVRAKIKKQEAAVAKAQPLSVSSSAALPPAGLDTERFDNSDHAHLRDAGFGDLVDIPDDEGRELIFID